MVKQDEPMIDVRLEDGSAVRIPERLNDEFVGIDYDGDVVIMDESMTSDDGVRYLYALTPCCFGSGKGMDYETGVGCRGCYREVDSKFGGRADLAVERAR